MFGSKKLMESVKAWLEIQTTELIKRNDLLATQNELLVRQVEYTRQLAISTRKIDEFNRMTYQAESGMQVPDNAQDEKSFNEFQEYQQGERDAVNDMYFGDIALGGELNEE